MKILITGKDGQVGQEMVKQLSKSYQVHAFNKKELNITNDKEVKQKISKIMPDVFINSAAYTNVDQSEKMIDLAYNVNAKALEIIAKETSKLNCLLVHFSTDYVFDGKKNKSYQENDIPNPLNVYGKSKLLGEKNIQFYNAKHIIFRIGSVYSQYGNNFLKTILRKSFNNEKIYVVNDQFCTPTSVDFIVKNVRKILEIYNDHSNKFKYGIFNLSPTGHVSWHKYSNFIIKQAIKFKFEVKSTPDSIFSVKAKEMNFLAKRPNYSVLNSQLIRKTFGLNLCKWETDVIKILKLLKRTSSNE